jgi:hypothetical protein
MMTIPPANTRNNSTNAPLVVGLLFLIKRGKMAFTSRLLERSETRRTKQPFGKDLRE